MLLDLSERGRVVEPFRLIVVAVVAIALSELLLTLVLFPRLRGVDPVMVGALDALVLATVVTVVVYLFLGRPFFGTVEELESSRKWFEELVEVSPVGVFSSRPDGTILYVNEALAEILGFDSREEMVDEGAEARYAESSEREEFVERLRREGQVDRMQVTFETKEGEEVECLLSGVLHDDTMSGFVHDVSELRETERELETVNRALRTLSAGNSAMLRAESEEGLIQGVCRAAVEVGGYPGVWVARLEDEELVPVGGCGVDLSGVSPEGGPEEAALSGDYQVESDLHLDEVREAGVDAESYLAMPLEVGDSPYGVLVIYLESEEPREGEVGLLREMSLDLAFGIEALRTTREMERAERRYRGLLRTSTDAVVVADEDRRIQFWNEAAEETLGYSAGEVAGERVDLLVPEEYGDAHVAGYERFLETGESGLIGDTVELEAKRKDGGLIPVELSLSHLEQGDSHLFTGVIRDVTGRRAREERLEESEEKYRLLAENSRDVIFRQDLEGNLEYVSPAAKEVSGYEPEELEGRNVREMMTEESYREAITTLRNYTERAREGEVDIPLMEYEYVRKDGSRFWGEIQVSFLRDEDGDLVGVQGVLRDVTERKGSERRLRRQKEELEVLNRLLRHNLRNDLNYVEGVLKDLEEESPEGEREVLKEAEGVLDGVLDQASKVRTIQRSVEEPELHPVDAAEICRRCVEKARKRFPDAELVYVGLESGATVVADELLGEVVDELIENAVEHNLPEPEVHVRVKKGGGEVVVSVEDDGEQIPEGEKLPVLEGEETALEHASGIGLWMVRWSVDKFGGSLEFGESESGGNRVELHLPSGTQV